MTESNLGQEYSSPTVAEYRFPDLLYIPDISLVTKVDLPELLDLTDTEQVTNLIENLLNEEKNRNQQFLGGYLCGSVAWGKVVSSSDIDLVLVVDTKNEIKKKMKIVERIRLLLQLLFEVCYGIKSDIKVIDTCDISPGDTSIEMLDKASIPVCLDVTVINQINTVARYSNKPQYSGDRPYKVRATPPDVFHPKRFSIPGEKLYPWWASYALLDPIP